jgi:two-component system chemotaxis response regulator CheB
MLKEIFSKAPGFEVVGAARDGNSAVKMACELNPDVITMDVYMPDMNGYEATDKILRLLSVPIVIVSSRSKNHELDFRAMEAGAVAVAEKPGFVMDSNFLQQANYLISLVRSMSEVKVVRRRHRDNPQKSVTTSLSVPKEKFECRIAAIGISTGGPPIIAKMLDKITQKLPFPVCLIQHIAEGFTDSLTSWLAKHCVLPVKCMEEGQRLEPGVVYVAPGGYHVGFKATDILTLMPVEKNKFPAPSIDMFFDSVRKYYGDKSIGVLMSGMGRDGAEGLLRMRNAGAETIVQDRETAVVYGMPGEALRQNAAKHVMSPDAIMNFIIKAADN